MPERKDILYTWTNGFINSNNQAKLQYTCTLTRKSIGNLCRVSTALHDDEHAVSYLRAYYILGLHFFRMRFGYSAN